MAISIKIRDSMVPDHLNRTPLLQYFRMHSLSLLRLFFRSIRRMLSKRNSASFDKFELLNDLQYKSSSIIASSL